jgi:EmrB/QacA subfamily drug resistance transporter
MTTTSDVTVRPGTDISARAERRRWFMLIVLLVGQFMALLDVTIVNVAMPTIGADLRASGAALQLVVAGYTVCYAMLLITGARLGDLFGRRRMFLIGVLTFTLSSLICGLAPNSAMLIGARFVQGAGAAAMMPQIISVIQTQFTGAARAKALSAYSAVIASGFVTGQVLGGVLVSADLFGSGWRPVFLVNVPVGLAVAAAVPRLVTRDERKGSRRIDLAGLAIAVPAVFLVVLPLVLGHEQDWPAWTLWSIAAGLLLVPVFVLVERRVAGRGGDPLLNLGVLRAPGLVSGLIALSLVMTAYAGFLFSLALHLQAGLGDSAMRAGLTFAPAAVAFGLCSFYWRTLPERTHHLLAPSGLVVAAVAFVALGLNFRAGGHGGASAQLEMIVFGAGMGFAFSSTMTHALVHVPLHEAPDASGVITTALQLFQVVGVATLGSVFLTLAERPQQAASGHAVSTIFDWVAVLMVLGAAAALPLTRVVVRARRAALSAG